MHSLAIFGGTFDPIHQGHIQISLNIQSAFHFDAYFFLPCKIPTLKATPHCSTKQRIEMLQLALEPYPQFKMDLREIKRDTPSYMVETLASFRKDYPQDSINLILGDDAFLSLPLWHEWEQIIKLANLLVIKRRTSTLGEVMQYTQPLTKLLIKHQTKTKTDILNHTAGAIYLFDAGHYEISSTEIREAIKNNKLKANQIPEQVVKYIKQWALYQ